MSHSWIARVVAIGAFALGSGAALAHKASDSYLTLRVEDAAIEGQWDIALRDLDLAVGLDADGDGAITWGEVRSRHDAIAAYALRNLAVSNAGEACPLAVASHLVDEHSDGAYAVLRIAGRCARPIASLEVAYSLLFDLDAQHRGLLKLEGALGTRSVVFPADNRVQAFRLAESRPLADLATFIADGMKHIAIGFDHILFLVALLLPAVLVRRGRRWEPTGDLPGTMWNVVRIVTAFTVAHSITLSLAALQVVQVPSRLVESLIAISVLATALDNIVAFLPRRRWLVAFVFGLLHGFGFASVLIDLQLPRSALVLSLFGFNIGVELGQLALVALVVPLAHLARGRRAYSRYAVAGGSGVIAFVALGWFIERAFQFTFMPF